MLREKIVTKLICPAIHTGVDMNEQTCYDWVEDRIIFGYDFDNDDEWHFMRHLKEEHGCEFASSYAFSLWSILHELGHRANNDIEYEDELQTRLICSLFDPDCNDPSARLAAENLYYGMKSEWDATEWAIEWITTHPFVAKILNSILTF